MKGRLWVRRRGGLVLTGLIALFFFVGVGPGWMFPQHMLANRGTVYPPRELEVWRCFIAPAFELSAFQDAVRRTAKHPDEIRWNGDSLLVHCVRSRWHEGVAWLLTRGADPNGVWPRGEPLNVAAGAGDMEMTRLLLAHGADPRITNQHGDSALDAARRGSHTEIVSAMQRAIEWASAKPR